MSLEGHCHAQLAPTIKTQTPRQANQGLIENYR